MVALFFKLGMRHVLDIYAVKHVLFFMALAAIFMIKDWRKVLILISSCAIGYLISFYPGFYKIIHYRIELIYYLVPVTVFITALSNILRRKDSYSINKNLYRNYFLALIFGFVHGFEYAYYFSGIAIKQKSVIVQSIAFVFGIFSGSFLIVLCLLLIAWLIVSLIGVNRRDWVMVVSAAIAGVALTMMFESKFW